MKLAHLALSILAMVIGCSEPDVSGFDGTRAQPSAGADDDDSSTSSSKNKKSSDVLLDDDDDDGKETKDKKKKDDEPTDTGTPPTPTEPTPSPAECYAACLAPIPEAAALNECSNKCPDNDAECLDDCFNQSGCGDNPKCTPALSQCGLKCPGAEAQ